MSEKNYEAYHNLLFSIRRSVRYHIKRRQFFENIDRFIKIIVTLSGLGTFAAILSKLGDMWSLAVSATVAFFSTVDLIIRTSDYARLHSDLERRFIDLEKRMISENDDNITDKKLSEYLTARLEIEAEEPAKKAILDIICHNELSKSMGYNTDEQVRLNYLQRIAANYCDIGLHKVCKSCEKVTT